MNEIIDEYINIEVERLTSNIVNSCIHQLGSNNSQDYLIITRDNNKIENISYNTSEINNFTDNLTSAVQKELLKIEDGEISNFPISNKFKIGKYKHIRNGLLCDVSLSSIKGSTLFSNIGPTIPIKFTFIGQVNTNLDIQIQEYGINNVMVQIYVVVTIYEQASMPISSRKHEIIIRQPLSIDIIRGDIPDYYNGFGN